MTDTVEWVKSEKKEASSQETYTKVSKDTIAEPSLTASLNLDLGILRIMQQSMLASDVMVIDDAFSHLKHEWCQNSEIQSSILYSVKIFGL